MASSNVSQRKLFYGCCHPKGQADDYKGFLLKQNDMRQKAEAMKGLPILDCHNKDLVVGEVLNGWIGKTGGLYICGWVNGQTPQGKHVVEQLNNKKYQGLSLGIKHNVIVNNSSKKIQDVISSEILEVSVCEEGDLEDTFIITLAAKGIRLQNISQVPQIATERKMLGTTSQNIDTTTDKRDITGTQILHDRMETDSSRGLSPPSHQQIQMSPGPSNTSTYSVTEAEKLLVQGHERNVDTSQQDTINKKRKLDESTGTDEKKPSGSNTGFNVSLSQDEYQKFLKTQQENDDLKTQLGVYVKRNAEMRDALGSDNPTVIKEQLLKTMDQEIAKFVPQMKSSKKLISDVIKSNSSISPENKEYLQSMVSYIDQNMKDKTTLRDAKNLDTIKSIVYSISAISDHNKQEMATLQKQLKEKDDQVKVLIEEKFKLSQALSTQQQSANIEKIIQQNKTGGIVSGLPHIPKGTLNLAGQTMQPIITHASKRQENLSSSSQDFIDSSRGNSFSGGMYPITIPRGYMVPDYGYSNDSRTRQFVEDTAKISRDMGPKYVIPQIVGLNFGEQSKTLDRVNPETGTWDNVSLIGGDTMRYK